MANKPNWKQEMKKEAQQRRAQIAYQKAHNKMVARVRREETKLRRSIRDDRDKQALIHTSGPTEAILIKKR